MISVVVPTRDRPAALARCLAALARQQAGDELEIVVVNDGGRPLSAPGARIVQAGGDGPAAARNAGARAARGGVVCFTDDDCVPGPEWASRLAAACAGGGAAAGTTIADPAAGAPAAAAQLLTNTLMAASRDPGGGLRFAPTCNLACQAGTLAGLPFDESFALAAGEDRDWCARLVASGAPLRHVPDAVVLHRPQLGARALLRQQARYGRGAVGFRDAGGALAGAGFYAELVRGAARAGPRVAAFVALAQAAVAAGAAAELLQQRRAR